MSIGERIKKLRKHLDLTQQKFGERLGIKGNTVAQYELGRNEPIDAVLSLLCKEFNVNEQQKLMKYTALLLKNKDSAIATAIQTLIVTYEQLDDTSKATLEKIALQYIDNLKKSQ